MHYAFDAWMERNYPHIPFERYADDAVVHCKSGEEAQRLKTLLKRGCWSAGWNCILIKQRLFIVRIVIEEEVMPM